MPASGVGERGKKKRAGRACVLCRARKVRCDAVLNGVPCTNCRLDSLECTIPKNKRHRYVFECILSYEELVELIKTFFE